MRALTGVLLTSLMNAGPARAQAPTGDALAAQAAKVKEMALTSDPRKGWDLFRDKACIRCHAVWGEGGSVGSDLGRTRTLKHLSAGEIAGVMWNHVPRMWEKMEEKGIRLMPISGEEMGHLFAFLLFIRYAEEPGDAVRGEHALARYRCQECHALATEGGTVGPDLQGWARFVNPIVWAQKMWMHAPAMMAQMRALGIAWPTFSENDLGDIVAFIRARTAGEEKEYIAPGSPARGKDLFQERGCAACHPLDGGKGKGPDLEKAALPDTPAGIASQMWNHAPKMLRAIETARAPALRLGPQDMADIIAYLITRRYFLAQGDPVAGRRVFLEKQCVSCHVVGGTGGDFGPALTPVRGSASAVLMAHVMWSSGPLMLDAMADQGIPWPNFEGSEMSDLIAYLDAGTPAQTGAKRE
ncbi:MAG: c-type cytochrome [Myxococcota bacterium]